MYVGKTKPALILTFSTSGLRYGPAREKEQHEDILGFSEGHFD
jgi:hypothetical protein